MSGGHLASSQPGLFLALCASNDHLARIEHEGCGLWLFDANDASGEPLRVVLCVPGPLRNGRQVQLVLKITCRHNILQHRNDAGRICTSLITDDEFRVRVADKDMSTARRHLNALKYDATMFNE